MLDSAPGCITYEVRLRMQVVCMVLACSHVSVLAHEGSLDGTIFLQQLNNEGMKHETQSVQSRKLLNGNGNDTTKEEALKGFGDVSDEKGSWHDFSSLGWVLVDLLWMLCVLAVCTKCSIKLHSRQRLLQEEETRRLGRAGGTQRNPGGSFDDADLRPPAKAPSKLRRIGTHLWRERSTCQLPLHSVPGDVFAVSPPLRKAVSVSNDTPFDAVPDSLVPFATNVNPLYNCDRCSIDSVPMHASDVKFQSENLTGIVVEPCAPSAHVASVALTDDRSFLSDEGSGFLASTCIICFDAIADHVMIPCGHGGFCGDCARKVLSHEPAACPTCRADAVQVVKVHSSTKLGGLSSTCLPD